MTYPQPVDAEGEAFERLWQSFKQAVVKARSAEQAQRPHKQKYEHYVRVKTNDMHGAAFCVSPYSLSMWSGAANISCSLNRTERIELAANLLAYAQDEQA